MAVETQNRAQQPQAPKEVAAAAKPKPLTAEQIAIVKSTAPILKEHGVTITTRFYRQMLEAHPELRNIFNRANQASGDQPQALAGLVFAFAQHVDNLPVLAAAVERVAHKHVSLHILPEHYPIVGEHLIAAVAQVLGPDIVTPPVADAWIAAYAVLADVFIGREAQMYQANTLDGSWSEQGWRRFRIHRRVAESRDASITSFYLAPEDGRPLPAFAPGQYVSLRIPVPELGGVLQPRQYSLSDSPSPDSYRITVKREPWHSPDAPGLVSNLLHDKYHEGDWVELTHPMGEFSVPPPAAAGAVPVASPASPATKSGPIVLISAGVGITPMVSILNSAAGQRTISWIHGARSPQALAFSEHVASTVQSNRDTVYAHLFLTSSPSSPPSAAPAAAAGSIIEYEGRIDLDKVRPGAGGLFLKDGDDNDNDSAAAAEYFVCGPAAFMADVRDYLVAKGVDESRVHQELFGVAK